MSPDERYDLINTVLNNPNIKVPSYLDDSTTTKFMYAIGMDNKPKVVSDNVLDNMPGVENFRTVCDSLTPPPYTRDILNQIKTSDYTQLSSVGGSVHGRALYFADNFEESAKYGYGDKSAQIMRVKINPNALIVTEKALSKQMRADKSFMKKSKSLTKEDKIALYALSQGMDGWKDAKSGYTMMLNRGAMTVSSTNKWSNHPGGYPFDDWASAPNA